MPNPMWKRFMRRGGGHPPLYSDLLFYSKNRIGSTVVNKIDDNKNGVLVYNPLTDVIDIQDETKYPRGETTTGSGDTLHVWETVKLLTKLDDVIGYKTFKIVKDFDDFQAVDNGRSETDYYIMSNDINCSKAQTDDKFKTTSGGDYDPVTAYASGTVMTWTDVEGNIDRYIKTPYITNYVAGKIPTDTDTNGQKYWEKYNYTGFWINEFKGVFSGNGFELQNCYVNNTGSYGGVFSFLNGGKLSNIGVTCSVIGYLNQVGGLVGDNSSSSIITNSYSTGSVIGYLNQVGGLIGRNIGSTLTNSYSTCSVIGHGNNVGGLVGVSHDSSITTDSYSTGSVIGYGSSVGGLVGSKISSIITNSYYDSETSGRSDDTGKGMPRETEQMMDVSTYVGWDFTNTWAIDDGYPYLRMQVDNLANPISNSRIVNNYDGYILMPADIEIETGRPLFNRDDTDIYNSDATSTDLYLGDEMGGEEAYYWHISELNTATILSYMNNDYKNSWFVKNTFDGSEVKTIKEILAYNAPTTDAEDLAKIMKYLGIGE